MNHVWTKAEEDQLRQMWPSNTLTQLAARLHMTRSAVAGKARRMKLPRKDTPNNLAKKPRPEVNPIATRPLRVPAKAKATKPPQALGELPEVPPMPAVPHDLRSHCAFLLGDVPKTKVRIAHGTQVGKRRIEISDKDRSFGPPFQCWEDVPRCTHPKQEGSSYCTHHHSICYERRVKANEPV